MKVAILSESPADEAAVRILVEAALGETVEPVDVGLRRHGGFGGALAVVGTALRWLHYRRTAEALVVVVDSDDSPVHVGPMDRACENAEKCRLCVIRGLIAEVRRGLKPVAGHGPVKTAVGLAVPAIEAWCLFGKHKHMSEGAWVRGQEEGRAPYTRHKLKELVYGTDHPDLALETKRMTAEMVRVAADLDALRNAFPCGVGSLLDDLRGWRERTG